MGVGNPVYPIRGGTAILAFQAAIYKRLSTDAILTELVPGGIYDLAVPDSENEGHGVPFPYCVISGASEVPANILTSIGRTVSIPIDVYSLYQGTREAGAIANRIVQLLDHQESNLQVDGWAISWCVYATAQVMRDQPNTTVQVQLRFDALLKPIPFG